MWFLVLLTAGLTLMIGGVVTRLSQNGLDRRLITPVLAFACGWLLPLVWLEFLPHALKDHDFPLAGLLIIAGILIIMIAERYLAPRLHFLDHWLSGHPSPHDHSHCHADLHPHEPGALKPSASHHHLHPQAHAHHLVAHGASCSAVGCLIICSFFDGIQLQQAYALGWPQGLAVNLGVLLHMLPDGVVAAGLALSSGFRQKTAIAFSAALGISLCLGVGIAELTAHSLGSATHFLPIATGIMIYIIFLHLLPSAMKAKGSFGWFLGGLGLALWLYAAVLNHADLHSH